MDAFTARLGTSQGRVVRAPGDAIFVLGDLEDGRTGELAPGDYIEVVQAADLAGVGVVRVRGTLRTPARGRWRVSLRLGGEEVAGIDGWSGRARTVSDLAANVTGRTGLVELAVRLTLVGA